MTCILKAPFNSFSYELVGDGSATTFFQISSGGSVSLRQSVATDSSNMFQVLGISFQHLYHIRNKLCLNFSRKKIIWFRNTDRKHCTCKLKLIDEKHLVYLIFIFLFIFDSCVCVLKMVARPKNRMKSIWLSMWRKILPTLSWWPKLTPDKSWKFKQSQRPWWQSRPLMQMHS